MMRKARIAVSREFGIGIDDVGNLDYVDFRLMERELNHNPPVNVLLKAFFMGDGKGSGKGNLGLGSMPFRTREEQALARAAIKRQLERDKQNAEGNNLT